MLKQTIYTFLFLCSFVAFCKPTDSSIAAREIVNYESSDSPYDSEVEYLESDGRQFIDTGFTFSIGYTFMWKMQPVGPTATGLSLYWFGANSSGHEVLFQYNGTIYWGARFNTAEQYVVGTDLEYVGAFEFGHSYLYRNGVKIIDSNSTPNNEEIYLFAWKNGNEARKVNMKFYYFKVYFEDSLVLDLIPVRKHGIGYMFDTVSGELFENLGTGEFIVGPDVN